MAAEVEKLLWTPTRSTPRTSAQISAMVRSRLVRGGTYDALRLARGVLGGGQRRAVHLAGGGQRQAVEDHEGRGHHVVGQGGAQVGLQLGRRRHRRHGTAGHR